MDRPASKAMRRHAAFNPKALRRHARLAEQGDEGERGRPPAKSDPSTLPRRTGELERRELRTLMMAVPGLRDYCVVVRALWCVVAIAAAAALALSRTLTPDPRGLGTHEELGLAPCGFLHAFQVPCPTCGLTTSFALLARFDLVGSFRAHALGLPLFLATALLVVLAARAAVRADPPAEVVARYRLDQVALVLALALLATWCARLGALLIR